MGNRKRSIFARFGAVGVVALLTSSALYAQDNINTGTNTGADRIRIAAANFRGDASGLKQTFDTVL
ncbi:MAG: hypothetical protein V4734_08565, partial [Terriglobus sp.]